MAEWTDGYWQSADGLRLHYRDYAGGADGRPPILCIPGLTRNARDFEGVAARLAGDWRVLCVDLRGRGGSDKAPDPATYNPLVYLQDVQRLVAELGLARIVLFGTSLGGLVSLLFANAARAQAAGLLLNDVGPVIEEAGLATIRAYVGRYESWPTWSHAGRALKEAQGDRYPDWSIDQWIAHAKRACRLNASGNIVFDYDMAIAEPLKAPAPAVDLWPAFDALAGIPALLVRGALSDILSRATAEEMVRRNRDLESVTVPGVGHAPMLDEPEAVAGIDHLLERVARAG
ncbi:MAG: alpha/beta hydrolase [Alphaproteobacteria bacterium]|nr:alpha/beta hydrolase [Alphaproteobacteria bacterium]